jgi:hypothetical protein
MICEYPFNQPIPDIITVLLTLKDNSEHCRTRIFVFPKIIVTEVRPRLLQFRLDMASARDKLFGDLIKTVAKWQMPTMSLAYLAGLNQRVGSFKLYFWRNLVRLRLRRWITAARGRDFDF